MTTTPRKPGRPKLEQPKVQITLRLDQDVVTWFRATGPRWRTRINEALKASIDREKRDAPED